MSVIHRKQQRLLRERPRQIIAASRHRKFGHPTVAGMLSSTCASAFFAIKTSSSFQIATIYHKDGGPASRTPSPSGKK